MTSTLAPAPSSRAPSRAAVAVPQLPGEDRPHGSVLYVCSGTNEFGKPCAKLLLVWVPDSSDSTERVGHGRAEVKCRRCKQLNHVALELERD